MRRINCCFNNELLSICRKSLLLDELNSKLKAFLPSSLAMHCQAASFNKGCLIITIKAAWATELRYYLPELRDKLRKEQSFCHLIAVNLRISEVNQQAPPSNKKRSVKLSNESRSTIRSASELCNYPPLKEALFRLAEDQDV